MTSGHIDELRQTLLKLLIGGFSKRQFLTLWMAQGISQFGDALLEITLPVWVGIVTHSSEQVAGVAAAELLPVLLSGPVAGVLAERVNPKAVMAATDLFRSGAVLLLFGFHGKSTVYFAYIVSFLLSLGTRLFVPAQNLAFRRMVSLQEIPKSQAVFRIASSISLAVGPALGGLLLMSAGWKATVTMDACTFLISAILISGLRIPAVKNVSNGNAQNTRHIGRANNQKMRVKRSVASAMRAMRRSRVLIAVVISTASSSLVGFVWFTVDVFYVRNYMGLPGEAVGYLWTATGIGNLVAESLLVLVIKRVRTRWILFAGMFVRGFSLLAYALMSHLSYGLVICFTAGIGEGFTATANAALTMRWSSRSMLGRISSLIDSSSQVSSIVGAALVSVATPRFTSRQVLVSCGILLSVVGVLLLMNAKLHANPPSETGECM